MDVDVTHPDVETLVVYHSPCPDGWGARIAAELALGGRADYVGRSAGGQLEDVWVVPARWVGRSVRVYFLDCAPSVADLEYLVTSGAELVDVHVVDHHLTNREFVESGALDRIPDRSPVPLRISCSFGERSGAVLAWQRFHPGRPVPLLFQYIEDRDLWTWRLKGSRAVSAYLSALGENRERWRTVLARLDDDPDQEALCQVVEAGELVLAAQDQVVGRLVERAWLRRVSGDTVVVVNASSYHSDVGDALLKRYGQADYAAMFWHEAPTRVKWSLRSRPGGVDVAKIAQAHGGGGHAQAAGFSRDLTPPPASVGGDVWGVISQEARP